MCSYLKSKTIKNFNKFNYFNLLSLKYIIRRNASRNKSGEELGNVTKKGFISTIYKGQSEISEKNINQ